MKYLENYNYYKDKKKIKNDIKNILDNFYLEYIFDYKITKFIINVDDNKIDISIFGYGKPYLDKDKKKEDALLKLIFEEKRDKWNLKIKKSNIFKKIQHRNVDITLDNLNIIKNEVLKYLNN